MFKPLHAHTFMGGTFKVEQPKSVAELRELLREMDAELEGWGDETEISEVCCRDGGIDVTLKHGLDQGVS